MHAWIELLVGIVLLLAGRKLFWLFVALAGFYVGFEIVRVVVEDRPQWLIWLAAAGAGVIGAVAAVLFQRVAFGLGGFYAGGYLALLAAERYAPGSAVMIAFFIGAALGAIAAVLLMDWAIIVLSSMLGAALIVPALGLSGLGSILTYAGCIALGIIVQAHFARRGRLLKSPG